MQTKLTEEPIVKTRFLVYCPHCYGRQVVEIRGTNPTNHRKKCIYCGKSFIIFKNIRKHCIIKRIK